MQLVSFIHAHDVFVPSASMITVTGHASGIFHAIAGIVRCQCVLPECPLRVTTASSLNGYLVLENKQFYHMKVSSFSLTQLSDSADSDSFYSTESDSDLRTQTFI
jgi:hypothetical protein